MMREAFFVGLVGFGMVACSDPCGELEEQCGNCSGSDDQSQVVEMACNAVVDADNDDACDAALDSSAYKCP